MYTQARSLTLWTLSTWFLKRFKCWNSRLSSLHFGWLHDSCFTPPSCRACFLSKWSYTTAGRQYLNVLSSRDRASSPMQCGHCFLSIRNGKRPDQETLPSL